MTASQNLFLGDSARASSLSNILGDIISSMHYGNWTGAGWSAGHSSPPGEAYTDADRMVPGVDNFDNNASKPHDFAYEAAQQQYLADIRNGMSSDLANAKYHASIAGADAVFVRNAILNDASTATGETYRMLGIMVMTVKGMVEIIESSLYSGAYILTSALQGIWDGLESATSSIIDLISGNSKLTVDNTNSIISEIKMSVNESDSLFDGSPSSSENSSLNFTSIIDSSFQERLFPDSRVTVGVRC